MAYLQRGLSNKLLKIIGQSVIRGRGMCIKELDKPVKFSSSKAASWKASFSRSGEPSTEESAWFEPYVVMGSVAAFLLYFCVFREESDIDDMLEVPLYNRIEGLEEAQLRSALKQRLDKGLPTKDISDRLKELEAKN